MCFLRLDFGLEKNVLLLSQSPQDIPFDTRTFRTLTYDPHNFAQLTIKLLTYVQAIQQSNQPSTTAVTETAFVSNYEQRKSTYVVPPSKPVTEIYLGSTVDRTRWLQINRENISLIHAAPDLFRVREVLPRRDYFEIQSAKEDTSLEIFDDGFLHAKLPIEKYENAHYLSWTMMNLAEVTFLWFD